ncbi:MAG: hypothetical protein E6Q76_05770 [Rhizobium sp.]|nr:MAG: hypothetical protein E6Q76_05770 [Rhizobium sp.]
MKPPKYPFNSPLVVLAMTSRTGVAAGSAVVAMKNQYTAFLAGQIPCLRVYYEGAIYEPMPFHERLRHAAGRLLARYPTSAELMVFQAKAIKEVGAMTLDPFDFSVLDAQALRAWGVAEDEIKQAVEHGPAVAAERALLAKFHLQGGGATRSKRGKAGA